MRQVHYSKVIILAIVALIVMTAPCLALKRVVPETTKKDIIDTYFKERTLDAVEGIWAFSVDGFYEEIAIIKNPSEKEYKQWMYVGVIVNNNSSLGKVGEAKIVLEKTDTPGVYSGNYVVQSKQGVWNYQELHGATFIMPQSNVIRASVRSFGTVSFVRIDKLSAARGAKSAIATGTGFFINPTTVITNYHVIADAKKIEVTFQNEHTVTAQLLGKDESNDVAVLQVEGLADRVVPLPLGITNSVREGERVYTIGFPLSSELGTRHKISEGLVNGLSGIRDDPTVFQISIPIQPGNSGGPLITSDGRVIGITSGVLSSVYYLRKTGTVPQNVNFAVKTDYILPVLSIVGINVERKDKQSKALDPVVIMDMGKLAVVYVKSYIG